MPRAEIDRLSRAVAEQLAERRAVPGRTRFVTAVNGAGFLAALVGTRRAGLIPVLADASSPAAERARVAAALGAAFQIECDEPFPKGPDAIRVRAEDRVAGTAPEGAGYVKLTSRLLRSTRRVAIAPEALAADDDQLASSMGLRASDRFVAAIPWSHSYGLSSLVMPALRRGSLLVIPDDGGPWAALEAASSLAATVFPTVPVYLQTIASLAAPPAWPTSLRTVISAGAPLHAETAARFKETFGRDAHVFYGASRCGGIAYDREGGAALARNGGDAGRRRGPHPRRGRCGPRPILSGRPRPRAGSVPRLGGGVFRSADLASWTPEASCVSPGAPTR